MAWFSTELKDHEWGHDMGWVEISSDTQEWRGFYDIASSESKFDDISSDRSIDAARAMHWGKTATDTDRYVVFQNPLLKDKVARYTAVVFPDLHHFVSDTRQHDLGAQAVRALTYEHASWCKMSMTQPPIWRVCFHAAEWKTCDWLLRVRHIMGQAQGV